MKTLAVVIGNNDYYENAKLLNAVNDANAIVDVFIRLGYDVIHKTDCSMQISMEVLEEFEKRIPDYDATIFYFAGHGFELDGENYLASIECQVANPTKYHCKMTCIVLTEVLQILNKNSEKVNIVIIDACRKAFERGTTNAFSPVRAPKGTLIAFSTSPNESAKGSGLDGHSIYTGALLTYIGRQWISVEELFKKVRKTVFNLSEGRQTTWEHTSLIGDFHFNVGQLVHSIDIPYDASVVKDSEFKNDGNNFSELIHETKSGNWNRQNDAIEKIFRIKPQKLNKNQQFILGRNLLQAADGHAHEGATFFRDLQNNLKGYSIEGENHLLNGILFEIYFDSYGEFRREKFKTPFFDAIMGLRNNPAFEKSFGFISALLEPYRDILYWIPSKNAPVLDIDVVATTQKTKGLLDDFYNDLYDQSETITNEKEVSAVAEQLLDKLDEYDEDLEDIINLMREDLGIKHIDRKLKTRTHK